LDGGAGPLGYEDGGAFDDGSDLYAGVYRRRRNGDALGHDFGCGAECADAELYGITTECGQRRELDIDVEYYERDELYRVGIVDRDQSDVGRSDDQCADDQRELHANVYGRRWIDLTDRGGDGNGGVADADADRVSGDRAVGNLVESDVEHDGRHELRGIRCLERCQGNVRHPEHRCAQHQLKLHAGVCRGWWHRDANGYGDRDPWDAFR